MNARKGRRMSDQRRCGNGHGRHTEDRRSMTSRTRRHGPTTGTSEGRSGWLCPCTSTTSR
eukprot:16366991-Heterocapsa_arctica.AAC.1